MKFSTKNPNPKKVNISKRKNILLLLTVALLTQTALSLFQGQCSAGCLDCFTADANGCAICDETHYYWDGICN
jgi:hypothetical protein